MKMRKVLTIVLVGILVSFTLVAVWVAVYARKVEAIELKKNEYAILKAKNAQMETDIYGLFKVTEIGPMSGASLITFRYFYMDDDSNMIIIWSPEVRTGTKQVSDGAEGISFSFFQAHWTYKDGNSIWLIPVSDEDAKELSPGFVHNKICITHVSEEAQILGRDLAAFECAGGWRPGTSPKGSE